MRNAYQVVFDRNNKNVSTTADQCYCCNKFFIERKSLQRHMNVCGHLPRIVYKSENQNMQTFLDNIKFMGDIPFSIYFDLEIATGKKIYNLDEDATLYPVSYAFVVAFHPLLNIEKITIFRSFNHTFEQLNDVSYLSDEMLPYIDPITTRQLRNCAAAVFNKKKKYSLIEMFSCKLKFVIDLLKSGLQKNILAGTRNLIYFQNKDLRGKNPLIEMK